MSVSVSCCLTLVLAFPLASPVPPGPGADSRVVPMSRRSQPGSRAGDRWQELPPGASRDRATTSGMATPGYLGRNHSETGPLPQRSQSKKEGLTGPFKLPGLTQGLGAGKEGGFQPLVSSCADIRSPALPEDPAAGAPLPPSTSTSALSPA